MSKRKKYNISPYLESRDTSTLEEKSGNLYQAIVVLNRRANQISMSMREELHSKLNEFASNSDTLEEIHENKEQIEISKYYERMPHPTLLALEEFLEDKIYYRNQDDSNFKRKEAPKKR